MVKLCLKTTDLEPQGSTELPLHCSFDSDADRAAQHACVVSTPLSERGAGNVVDHPFGHHSDSAPLTH